MKLPSLLFTLLIASSLSAQTLFTYADKSVSASEYTKAFNKVYPAPVADKAKKMRNYLDLYINSKLKIHEAMSRGYDTMPGFVEEYTALRNQVIENYMNDAQSLNALVNEAFDRSQKDIRVQHIFIPYYSGVNYSDSPVVKIKMQEAYMELQSGKSFDDVALKFSADPAVAQNKGNLGYITVFSLPYQFENVIYNLAPGKFSAPYRSNSGYHIFKNLGERKAVGRIKVSQILVAVPPGSDEPVKKKLAALADSLYDRLLKGDDFGKLATAFSNDVVSSASKGSMPEFGLGTFDPAFEAVAFSLTKNGELSKPFLTAHGYHIIKRTSLIPPLAVKNKKSLDMIRILVEKDGRVNVAKDKLYNKILAQTGYKQFNVDHAMLQMYLDSVLASRPPSLGNPVNKATALFSVGQSTKIVNDLITYSIPNRYKTDGSGMKPFNQLNDEFKRYAVMEYYRAHLEDFNEEFNMQMKELKDGNLFFDIMMKEVWSNAQSDTAGQRNYYDQNKTKYKWNYSADAVIFYCGDAATAKSFRDILVKDKSKWKTVLENFSDKITSDSARFEITKIPGAQKTTAKAGMITNIVNNKDDNSASFAIIFKLYPLPGQKTFADARGDVVSDFQDSIDKKWIAELKKKYPVKVNEEVLKTIAK
ncbi:MAG TPA: peptidylprolyl isomerase [Chitinophagaceae bacterium]|nr:peptidylprolyl isomerase [Chitinophagaceae bacterium]